MHFSHIHWVHTRVHSHKPHAQWYVHACVELAYLAYLLCPRHLHVSCQFCSHILKKTHGASYILIAAHLSSNRVPFWLMHFKAHCHLCCTSLHGVVLPKSGGCISAAVGASQTSMSPAQGGMLACVDWKLPNSRLQSCSTVDNTTCHFDVPVRSPCPACVCVRVSVYIAHFSSLCTCTT